MRRLLLGILAGAAALGFANVGGEGATAADPGGTGGLIAFSGASSGDGLTVYTVRADGSARQIVGAATWASQSDVKPVWSPDGRWVAYSDDWGLTVARPDGSARRTVGQRIGYVTEGAAWSPDGRTILVPSDGSLWRVDAAKGTARELPGWAWSPAWSPSGKQIAFLARDAVWVMRPDGSGRRRLAHAFDGTIYREPAPSWSPRGDKLTVESRGDVYVVDVLTGRATNLTRTPTQQDWEPVWSPDGHWIVFNARPVVGGLAGKAGLTLIRPDGTGRRTVAGLPSALRSQTWSPDSARIAAIRGGSIYVASIAGDHARRVMRPRCGEDLRRLVWSRRGGRLAFSSTGGGGNEIYVSRSDGTNTRRLATSCVWETDPAWSRDGRWIAYARAHEVYVMQADGSDKRRVVKGDAPSWSPDRSRIAFSRGGQIHVVGADGKGERQLTSGSGYRRDPAWSPRGDRIAFTGVAGGRYEVFVIDVKGSELTRLTFAGGWDPAWSADGTRIAYARESDIWVMRPDGSVPTQLTGLSAYVQVFSPSWSPDGAQIVFAEHTDQEGGGLAVVSSSGGEVHYLPYDPRFGAHSAAGYSGDFEFDVDDHFANSPDWQPSPAGG